MPRRAAKRGIDEDTFKVSRGVDQRKVDRAGGGGNRVILREGDTVPLQFLTDTDDFIEFRTHSFRVDGGQWTYVPCLKSFGKDECPLCEEEDTDISKTSWRFACVVYNKKNKKVQVLENGKEVAGRILYQKERSPERFLRRVFDLHRFPGSPAKFQLDRSDETPIKVANLETIDLDEYVRKAVENYYGDLNAAEPDELEEDLDDELPEDLDDELPEDVDDLNDEDVDDDDELDEDDDLDDDLDDDDLDDEDDELDDEEEEEEPPAKKRAAPRKSAAKRTTKKAPAKKSTTRRTPARRR